MASVNPDADHASPACGRPPSLGRNNVGPWGGDNVRSRRGLSPASRRRAPRRRQPMRAHGAGAGARHPRHPARRPHGAGLDRLNTAKTVAQLAATIGRTFGYGVLRAIAEMDETDLRRALAQLVEAATERGASPDVLRPAPPASRGCRRDPRAGGGGDDHLAGAELPDETRHGKGPPRMGAGPAEPGGAWSQPHAEAYRATGARTGLVH
jgi:hypothetical protein